MEEDRATRDVVVDVVVVAVAVFRNRFCIQPEADQGVNIS